MAESYHPPGEPPAVELAEQFADLEVIDGPYAGEIWRYEADHGGYLPIDPARRAEVERPCVDVGSVLLQVGAEIVRPVDETS